MMKIAAKGIRLHFHLQIMSCVFALQYNSNNTIHLEIGFSGIFYLIYNDETFLTGQ